MKWYVGWDWRDSAAFDVFVASLKERSSIDFEIIPLVDRDLRRKGIYWRPYMVDSDGQMWDSRDGKPFSTAFSFTRFAVPALEDYGDDLVIFSDPDMLVRSDPAEMIASLEPDKAVWCVHHDHEPEEQHKIDGVLQTRYFRKNWSSLMVMRPSLCESMTKYALNNQTGGWLHALLWVKDEMIGAIDERWNWLEGWSDPKIDPAIVHFTRGTPDMCEADYADEWRKQRAALSYQHVCEENYGR